eukprot:403345370
MSRSILDHKINQDLIIQLGSCIKKVKWVFENDDVYRTLNFENFRNNDPWFIATKQNSDTQVGLRIINIVEEEKNKRLQCQNAKVILRNFNYVEIDYLGYQYLPEDISQKLEITYQDFLENKKEQTQNFQFKQDRYQVDFLNLCEGSYWITNANTYESRLLKRFDTISVPSLKSKQTAKTSLILKSKNLNKAFLEYIELRYEMYISDAIRKMVYEKVNVSEKISICKRSYTITFQYPDLSKFILIDIETKI